MSGKNSIISRQANTKSDKTEQIGHELLTSFVIVSSLAFDAALSSLLNHLAKGIIGNGAIPVASESASRIAVIIFFH
jgi:hypothetical protein